MCGLKRAMHSLDKNKITMYLCSIDGGHTTLVLFDALCDLVTLNGWYVCV